MYWQITEHIEFIQTYEFDYESALAVQEQKKISERYRDLFLHAEVYIQGDHHYKGHFGIVRATMMDTFEAIVHVTTTQTEVDVKLPLIQLIDT